MKGVLATVAAALVSVAAAAADLDLFGRGSTGAADREFLHPDRAFVVSVDPVDADTVIARWEIAEGYYLYRDKLSFAVQGADGAEAVPRPPAGVAKDDPYFGRVEIYKGDLAVPVDLRSVPAADIELAVGYQGCAEAGICYPPIEKVLPVSLAGAQAGPEAGGSGAAGDDIAAALGERGTLLTIAGFFGFGLLLAFTPCVLPMLPILSGLIVGQGERLSTRTAFALSGVYVLAMAVVYAGAGVFAGLFGHNLQAMSQHPAVLVSFALVFVLLALSMFGFYELQVPAALQRRAHVLSDRHRRGTLGGAAGMGALSAVIVGPCVAPPLAGALLYIARSGDAVLGGTALFAMALGMGAPLVVVGTSAGRLLPRAGPWMESVKRVFGVVLLGVALWLLGRVLPGPVTLVLWGALLITSAMYMGAMDALAETATPWRRLWKGLGMAMVVYGATLVVGAAGGGTDVLRPLAGFTGGGTAGGGPEFVRVKDVAELQARLDTASRAGRPAMLDFYADWCVECKQLERRTFSDPRVRASLEEVTLLQADVTANDAADRALLERFELFGPPAILFFGPDGREQRGMRIVGFVGPRAFRAHLDRLAATL